jgi:hypothetical protein
MRLANSQSTARSSPLRRRLLLAWLVLLGVVVFGQAPAADANNHQLRDWILRWLGNPPIAAGGTRGDSGPPKPLCLLHPLIRLGSYPPETILTMPRPEVATATPLARITLKNAAGDYLGQEYLPLRPAAHGTAIPWPRGWPALEPGRTYQLLLQSTASSAETTVVLQAGPAVAFQQHRDLVAALGQRPEAWTAEISRLLAGSEPPTEASRVQAASLLFAAEAPPSRDLQRLRDALRRSHCLEMPR